MSNDYNTKNAALLSIQQEEMMCVVFEYAKHMFQAIRSVPRGNGNHVNVNGIIGALHVCNVWLLNTLSSELQTQLKEGMADINESSEYILKLCDNSILFAQELLSTLNSATKAQAEIASNRPAGWKPRSKEDLIKTILDDIDSRVNSGIGGPK